MALVGKSWQLSPTKPQGPLGAGMEMVAVLGAAHLSSSLSSPCPPVAHPQACGGWAEDGLGLP